MQLSRALPALLLLSMLLGSPPMVAGPGQEPLPSLSGECGRYAWIQIPGAELLFDQGYDLQASPDAQEGLFCVWSGDDEMDIRLCYACDEEGVWLVSDYLRTGVSCGEVSYADPPLVWRHDAEPGSTWTTDWSGVDTDCDEDDGAVVQGTQSVEVIGEERVTVPAGVFDTLVVQRFGQVHGDEDWSWVSEGLGLVQGGPSQDQVSRQLVGYEGL
jgi:hypothetical protein